MPKMNNFSLANPDDLTPYAVVKESWITDGRGHSSLRVPAKEGEKAVTVDLHPAQAQYLVTSGQVAPIPGETKGYPADAETGELLKLTDGERSAIQSTESLGQVEDGAENVLGQGKVTENLSTDSAAAQQETAQTAVELPATVDPQDVKTRSGRRTS